MKEKTNWWIDPANADIVKQISWWDHPENKTTLEIPVAIIQKGEHWTIGTNSDTEKVLGHSLSCIIAQGNSREDVILNFFALLRAVMEKAKQK